MVGAVAPYKPPMQSALTETDQTKQEADITAARQQLASRSNKTLTVNAVTKLDAMLGISGADPSLGASP